MSEIIEKHKVNPVNDRLTITATDKLGPGGAHHLYYVSEDKGLYGRTISFQKGPIAEAGINGLTHEVLLTILIDCLEGFQAGPFANEYNAEALKHIELALEALHKRTKERMARGVEGTSQP